MREGIAQVVRREEYRAPAFWIKTVELTFDLDPAKTIVGSRLRLQRNAAVDLAEHLIGVDLHIVEIDTRGVVRINHDGALGRESPAVRIDEEQRQTVAFAG